MARITFAESCLRNERQPRPAGGAVSHLPSSGLPGTLEYRKEGILLPLSRKCFRPGRITHLGPYSARPRLTRKHCSGRPSEGTLSVFPPASSRQGARKLDEQLWRARD